MTLAKDYADKAVERFSADLLKALNDLLDAGDDKVLQYEVKNSRTRVVVVSVDKFREVVKDARAKALGIEDSHVLS
jgi:succinate dehydrogenase flavin-adding protein (antitoxin of CptAB toxin-antitoxin module)